jgi:hypothetical protein
MPQLREDPAAIGVNGIGHTPPPAAKKDGFKSGLLATGIGKYTNGWPKAPDGMERIPHSHDEPSKTAKKKCVGVYTIALDGSDIKQIGTFRLIEVKAAPTPARDWAAERDAERRAVQIEARAARMAIPAFAGTALDGRISWPDSDWESAVEPDEDDENSVLVAAYIRVQVAEVEANKAEATARCSGGIAIEATSLTVW